MINPGDYVEIVLAMYPGQRALGKALITKRVSSFVACGCAGLVTSRQNENPGIKPGLVQPWRTSGHDHHDFI